MVRALITSKGKAEQQKGLLLVRQLSSDAALELLQLCIQTSNNEFIRSCAIIAIGQLPLSDPAIRSSAVDVMVSILATDEDYSVRAAAAAGMSYVTGVPEEVLSVLCEALLRALIEDSEWQVHCSCITSLGNLKQERALPILRQWLSAENELAVQAAVGAMGDIGNPSVVPDLLELLGRTDMMTRQRLAQALGQISRAKEEPAVIDALRTLSKDQSYVVRQAASGALADFGCAEVARAGTKSENELFNIEVARLLEGEEGKDAGASASEALRRRLERSFDKECARNVHGWNAAAPDKGVHNKLESAVTGRVTEEEKGAPQESGNMLEASEAEFESLVNDLKHGDSLAQTMASIRLRRFDGVRVAKAVLKTSALSPSQSSVRLRSLCVGLLARGGEVDKIIEVLLDDPDQNVRSACCDALTHVGGGAKAITACIATFKSDSHWLVRVSAAITLGSIGKESADAETELIESLKPGGVKDLESPQDSVIRRHAVTALGFLGSTRALPAIADLLRSEEADSAIRLRVAGALRGIHCSESATLVRSLIDDGDDEVSQMAQGTLDALAQYGFS